MEPLRKGCRPHRPATLLPGRQRLWTIGEIARQALTGSTRAGTIEAMLPLNIDIGRPRRSARAGERCNWTSKRWLFDRLLLRQISRTRRLTPLDALRISPPGWIESISARRPLIRGCRIFTRCG